MDIYKTAARRMAQAAKALGLREAVSRRFSFRDLLNVFGAAIRARLIEGGYSSGKHSHPGRRNPAGTKLVRSFIRQSGGESTYWRKRYFELTGRQYNQVEGDAR